MTDKTPAAVIGTRRDGELFKRPALGWRNHQKLLREFRQGGIADRWSERRLLILLAEYRLNCRREFMREMQGLMTADEELSKWSITRQNLLQVTH